MKLEDLEIDKKLFEPGCWQASWDLASAYLHILVASEYQKYLGFSQSRREVPQQGDWAPSCPGQGTSHAVNLILPTKIQ